MTKGRPSSSIAPAVCPSWCRGCGPNDPMHRGLLATIGRERTGWISVQLLVDRFARRDLSVKIDATHFGATQAVLLSAAQVDRLVEELTHARQVMRAQASRRGQMGDAR
ncbi:precorrin-4 C11-methyltransferase [Micromonospora rubida]|uniref:Precorrin-4 C11-methyltransferase n=1 Tax=Micromonospora rubida TaxID=2697657 RepID=A0ABW7SFP8_9ACTN